MSKIIIDSQEYETDQFSEEARKRLDMVLAVERRLHDLERDVAITQTARAAYLNALKQVLPGAQLAGPAVSGETLKFGP